MKLSDIELIVKSAEKACAAVINHPGDDRARDRLFNTLSEVDDPAFMEADGIRMARRDDLLRQANAWADIVCNRIDIVRQGRGSDVSASLIHYPARDLQRILCELIDELGGE